MAHVLGKVRISVTVAAVKQPVLILKFHNYTLGITQFRVPGRCFGKCCTIRINALKS
jgi:hypothetical protein